MNNVSIKCFIASKDPSSAVCQDSLAVNLKQGRFAIADGVTNSNHPEILSRLMTEAFVNNQSDLKDCMSENWNNVFVSACKEWKKQEEALFSSLTGRKRLHAQMRRDYYSAGASTLAGIEIDTQNRTLKYLLLGDSTLFVIGSNGFYMAVNSCATIEKKGQMIPFDNNPGSIVADGFFIGKWVYGEVPLQSGYIALMTDGCANWFQESFTEDPSCLEKLWEIPDNDKFGLFARDICAQHPKFEDDWTLILLKIGGYAFEMNYFPDNQPQALFICNKNTEYSYG